MSHFKKISLAMVPICATLAFTPMASAEMLWSDFSLSYLTSDQYKVGDNSRQFITVEHVSSHTWGDNFFFLDTSKYNDGTLENYLELSPRLNLGYVTGKDLSFGIVSDVYIATTLEKGEKFDNYLVGLGVSLNVPGFNYFTANIYQVNNQLWDNDKQLTITWGKGFKLGSSEFLYDGFVDWSSSSDTNAAEMNFTSQLKYNIGQVFDSKSPFYVGIEYAYWNNKFGISGVDERSVSLLVKWHF